MQSLEYLRNTVRGMFICWDMRNYFQKDYDRAGCQWMTTKRTTSTTRRRRYSGVNPVEYHSGLQSTSSNPRRYYMQREKMTTHEMKHNALRSKE